MQRSPAMANIEELITPALEALGYRFVQLRLIESGKARTLQLMAERQDEAAMNVDDCTMISRNISALLDVKDPITGAYNLEVSSPGIDRPLVRAEDFRKYIGYEVKIESALPIDGRKRFKGILAAADYAGATIALEANSAHIAYNNMNNAKLVLTDALVREHLTSAKKQRKQKSNAREGMTI